MRHIKLPTAKEEKVANKFATLISDLNLDLEALGYYLSLHIPHMHYLRLLEVLEAMEYNKEVKELSRGRYE